MRKVLQNTLWQLLVFVVILDQSLAASVVKSDCKGLAPASTNITKCYSKSPANLSDDICGDLCDKEAECSKESGACVCQREPTPTSLGGHFTHCTNWDYVEQSECKGMCGSESKNDSRVCWTFTVGNYCTCF